MTILVRNLEPVPVGAVITGWDVEPGEWEMRQGVDTDGDDKADAALRTASLRFERTAEAELRFAPAATTVITLKQKSKGTPYRQRPDWGIGPDDVKLEGATVKVRVHSLGSVAARDHRRAARP